MIVLVINAGSSSLKASLHDMARGSAEWDGSAPPPALWEVNEEWSAATAATAMPELLASMWQGKNAVIHGPDAIDAVGHRIVYAGPDHRSSECLTPAVRAAISRAAENAPTHDAVELAAADAVLDIVGASVPQVAVFDTAFHSTLAPAAYAYAIPYRWLAKGIRRYGFHGVSHQYAALRAARILGRDAASLRVVTCHLGSGCSLAAVSSGRSVDTTMGFTPLDGVVMATRSGAVDPGILIHLLRNEGYTADSLDRMLNHESGLFGLAGSSGDMREVIAAREAGDERAALALEVYVHRVRQAVAAMAASMGGMDALAFTAGVGEHAVSVRAEICEGLQFLGVSLDADANSRADGDAQISAHASGTGVVVVHAQENWAIAREAVRVVGAAPT